jgi:hypothetical protein
LSKEKEGEVSSACSDSLAARSSSNNVIETAAGVGIASSSAIQEEISLSDSPDISSASSGQNGGEIHVRADAESDLSHGTERSAAVQSQYAAVEQEDLRAESAEIFQHLPGASIVD